MYRMKSQIPNLPNGSKRFLTPFLVHKYPEVSVDMKEGMGTNKDFQYLTKSYLLRKLKEKDRFD